MTKEIRLTYAYIAFCDFSKEVMKNTYKVIKNTPFSLSLEWESTISIKIYNYRRSIKNLAEISNKLYVVVMI